MKMLNAKAASRLLLTSLCSLSFLAAPSKASAESCCAQPQDNCCEQQDNCCDTGCGSGWGKTALLVGGAIVAGGIAGAIAGHSSKHHHHSSGSCCSGEVGPTGPTGATGADGSNPFVVDETAVLSFSVPLTGLVLTINDPAATGSAEVIVFVTTPDGVVIDGDSVTSPAAVNATVSTSTITFTTGTLNVTVPVGDVVFGTYHVGLQINTAGIGAVALSTVALTTLPTTGATVEVETNNLPPAEETVALASFTLVAATSLDNDIQLETEYTYDPNNPSFVNP